jgi:hypothetical protein
MACIEISIGIFLFIIEGEFQNVFPSRHRVRSLIDGRHAVPLVADHARLPPRDRIAPEAVARIQTVEKCRDIRVVVEPQVEATEIPAPARATDAALWG